MARQRLTYRERDLAAALKILRKDGIKVGRVDIDKDGIHIVPAKDDVAATGEDDEIEADRARFKRIVQEM